MQADVLAMRVQIFTKTACLCFKGCELEWSSRIGKKNFASLCPKQAPMAHLRLPSGRISTWRSGLADRR
jgi:hypothetical protein